MKSSPPIFRCFTLVFLSALLTACGGAANLDDLQNEIPTDESALEGEVTLWSSKTVPAMSSARDLGAVELGVKIKFASDGQVNGIRFYKGSNNTGTHVGNLWTSSGQLLGTVQFTNETTRGWQRARFTTPISVKANTLYIASYFAPRGHYAGDNEYFANSSHASGPIIALSNGEAGGNGVYRYNQATTFPTYTWKATNYYVDVLFVPKGTTTPPPPTPPTAPEVPTTDCATKPSACGYPDATNTGPTTGTVFHRVPQEVTSGNGWAWESNFSRLRVTGQGAVLEGLDVTGPVVIDAPNVTLKNSIITSCGTEGDIVAIRAGNVSNGYNGDGAQILNNRLRCPTSAQRARSGVRDIYGAATNVLVRGNDISGTGNGITLEKNGIAEDNWIHDLGHLDGDHHSGLSNHGGASSIIFRHNTALLANTSTAGGGGLSGAITLYGDFARAQNVTVSDNLVSGGAYVFYGGINNESTYGQPTEIHIDRNRIVCRSWIYGPVFRRPGATNSFVGNYCDQDLSPLSD